MNQTIQGVVRKSVFETDATKLFVIGFIFFISGTAALIYQVAWQRILAFHSGAGIYSISMIVAAFLAGLGLGSYWGGLLSKKVTRISALRTFAGLELGIGIFAFLSCYVFYDLLYLKYAYLFSNIWRAGILHFLLLLIPTTMMGMSLPFITRATVANTSSASRTIGYLYGINVLGAALGALITPWVLIRLFGINGAIFFGAVGNIFTGLVALMIGSRVFPSKIDTVKESLSKGLSKAIEITNARPFALWLTLYTVSGFCAISLEIIWFRLIDVAVKSSAFTFGTVLAIFLLGLGAGSLIGGPLGTRVKRPLKLFLTFQCTLLIYSGIALFILVFIPHDWPFINGLVDYWGETQKIKPFEPKSFLQRPVEMLSLYGVLPIFLYGLPTLLMGLSFGVLQRAVQDDPKTSGFKVGILQSGNIAGNVAGSLVTGLLLLNFLGTAGAIKVILCIGLIFALIGIFYCRSRVIFSMFGTTLVVLFLVMPNGDQLWNRLHGLTEKNGLIEEDATAVVTLTPSVNKLHLLNVNGKAHSNLPYGGVASMIGCAPIIMHPSPKNVVVIGLGSGNTTWAAGCKEITNKITVYEIAASEEKLLRRVVANDLLPEISEDLKELLNNPRFNIITADGRNALALLDDDIKFDVIEIDVNRPWSSYSGNLYSVEFYELTSKKLNPGGIVRSNAIGIRNRLAFGEVFPYVIELNAGKALGWEIDHWVLVGSHEPIDLDIDGWLEQLNTPRIQNYFDSKSIEQLEKFFRTAQLSTVKDPDMKPNRDLFPRDEFRSPRTR